MTVEVFLDLICPRCYLALHHLQDALAVFEHGSEVLIVYRGFRLDPVRGRSFHEILVEDVMRNHRMTRPEADDVAADVQERLREAAGRDGLLYRPEAAGPVDTFAAHRMVHLAAAHDLGDAAVRGIQQLYFAEGIGIDDPERLEILVAGLGIDLDESSSVAHGDAYADAVLEDQARAAALGVATVPFLLFGERYALSGVRSQRWLLEALKHSWALWYS
jgi:predicted DsbA family dithiol-disulfide isomerase